MNKILYFYSSAEWVTDKVCNDIPKHAAVTATAKRSSRNNSGTLILSAHDYSELDKAVAYLARHAIYKKHFTLERR